MHKIGGNLKHLRPVIVSVLGFEVCTHNKNGLVRNACCPMNCASNCDRQCETNHGDLHHCDDPVDLDSVTLTMETFIIVTTQST